MKNSLLLSIAALMLPLASFAQGWEDNYRKDGYTVENTVIRDRRATIIHPENANGLWIVRPAFMGAFPQVDEALLAKGWTFGYFDVTEEYGNPDAQDAFTVFYEYARSRYNLSEKVTLEGLSRGGFFSLMYAVNNPDKIDKLYLDAPLCDLNLIKERFPDGYRYVLDGWKNSGLEFDDYAEYPRNNIGKIKDIPTIVVYGAADETVRFENHFGKFDLSGWKDLSIIGKTGCGHHPHSLSPCDTIVNFIAKPNPLPRAVASVDQLVAFDKYAKEVEATGSGVLSIMVLKDNQVLFERWFGEGAPDKPHKMFSVSKTFTSTAVGFAIEEGLLNLDDKVLSFFPDKRPKKVSKNLKAMTVRDLLTMTCGHGSDPTSKITGTNDWARNFLACDVEYVPGTAFCYNSMGSYMLSAIVQKLTGEKIIDYLTPRLFEPLGISGAAWEESPDGVCCGGWGLSLKTEDLAKMGTCLLNGGKFDGHQVIPANWVAEMGKKQVESIPGGQDASKAAEFRAQQYKVRNDWCQGYGYQMWRCRHNAFRADGAGSNYIIVLPDQNSVIVTTAKDNEMQKVLDCIWNNILPALQ